MSLTLKKVIIAIPLAFSLTGCVIVASDDGTHASWMNSDSKSEWKQEQKDNKRKIADLELGQSFVEVRETMGAPEFNEVFTNNGQRYQVLFYRTRHRHSDGQTTKDECTPLIFTNGTLTSWGDKAYRKL